MISLDLLTQQSLFLLLHQIDLDLAKQTKERRCPIVEDRCIMPTTGVSPVAVLLTLKIYMTSVTVCAVAVKGAAGVLCRRLSGFGAVGYTGLLSYC
jgi:hypothetical protein